MTYSKFVCFWFVTCSESFGGGVSDVMTTMLGENEKRSLAAFGLHFIQFCLVLNRNVRHSLVYLYTEH